MRIVSRSETPSSPPLDSILPREKSWALEVEREGETPCLRVEVQLPLKDTERLDWRESNCWDSSKGLNSDGREAFHRSRETENTSSSKRANRYFNPRTYRNDKHGMRRYDDSWNGLKHSEETSRARRFTCSSRCYPPTVHIGSSNLKRASQHHSETRRDLHIQPDKLCDGFVSKGLWKQSGNALHANTIEGRQGYYVCHNNKLERGSGHEGSEKHRDHADDMSRIQDGQELDGGKPEDRSSFGKHCHSGYSRHLRKFVPSEHRRRPSYIKKMGCQGNSCDVAGRKNEDHGRSAFQSETEQHNQGVLMEQSFVEKQEPTYIEEADITVGNGLAEGQNGELVCNEELESKMNDSLVVKKQYEMLASLLMDDYLDIDKDFDVTLAPGVPDSDCSGSIFGDDLELPDSMDVVTEAKVAMSSKAGEVGDCNGKIMKKASRKASAVRDSTSQPAGKSQSLCDYPGLKQFPTVFVDVTNKFEIHTPPGVKEVQEDDAHRLSQRQRQIEFGKNTLGYVRYNELIPRFKRKAKDPQTPNPKQVCSKRSWDGQIRKWRRLLHVYDPPNEDGEEIAEDFSVFKLHQGHRGGRVLDAEVEDTRLAHRFSGSNENQGCNSVDRKIVEDPNLTIYDDWMES